MTEHRFLRQLLNLLTLFESLEMKLCPILSGLGIESCLRYDLYADIQQTWSALESSWTRQWWKIAAECLVVEVRYGSK